MQGRSVEQRYLCHSDPIMWTNGEMQTLAKVVNIELLTDLQYQHNDPENDVNSWLHPRTLLNAYNART